MGRNPYDPITGMRGRRVQEPKRQQPAIRQDAGGQNIGRDANEHNVTAGKRGEGSWNHEMREGHVSLT